MRVEIEWKDLLVWRKERKMSQSELAKLLKVSRNTVWAWENAARRIPGSVLAALESYDKTKSKPEKPAPRADKPPAEWIRRNLPVEEWHELAETRKQQWRELWPE